MISDVAEFEIAFVVKEAIGKLGRGFVEGWDVGSIGEEDVGAAIVVVIEDGEAAGHGFDHVFGFGGIVFEDEIEAGGGGLLDKADGGWGCYFGGDGEGDEKDEDAKGHLGLG